MAMRKNYIDQTKFDSLKGSYKTCIRMLNGLEKSLENHLPESDRRWPTIREDKSNYIVADDFSGYPEIPNTEHLALSHSP